MPSEHVHHAGVVLRAEHLRCFLLRPPEAGAAVVHQPSVVAGGEHAEESDLVGLKAFFLPHRVVESESLPSPAVLRLPAEDGVPGDEVAPPEAAEDQQGVLRRAAFGVEADQGVAHEDVCWFAEVLGGGSVDGLAQAEGRRVAGGGEDGGESGLVGARPFPAHLHEEQEGFLVQTHLAAPADHRVPGGGVPLRHAQEEAAGGGESPVLEEGGEERGVGDDVGGGDGGEGLLGFFHGAELAIEVEEGAPHEDVALEAHLRRQRVELPAQVRAAEGGGGVDCGAEGELVWPQAEAEQAAEEAHGVCVAALAAERTEHGGGGDHVPAQLFLEQLVVPARWWCSGSEPTGLLVLEKRERGRKGEATSPWLHCGRIWADEISSDCASPSVPLR